MAKIAVGASLKKIIDPIEISTLTIGDQRKFWLKGSEVKGSEVKGSEVKDAQYYIITHQFVFMRDFYPLFFRNHQRKMDGTLVLDVLPGVIFHENPELKRLVFFLRKLTQHSQHKILFLISPLQLYKLEYLLNQK